MKEAFKLLKNLFINLLLFILATGLLFVFFLLGVGYSIYTAFWKRKVGNGIRILSDYFFISAYSVDQTGNAILGPLWTNVFCVDKTNEELKFGDPDKTISEQLGDNQYFKNLTKTGRFLCKVLNFIDANHVEKASTYYN